jgi:hypothetical protein
MLFTCVRRKVLLGVFLLFAGAAFAGTSEVYSVAVQLSSFNLLFTKVVINDHEVLALVDFGSSRTIEVSSSLAARLAIPVGNAVKIRSFGLGDFEQKNVTVEVTRNHIENIAARMNTSFDVIVGWGFFSRYDVLLDYKNSFLQFSDAPFKCPAGTSRFGYTVRNGVPVIEGVHIDTLKTNFLFDTGAPMCNIDVSIARFELPGATISKVIHINHSSFEPIFRVMDLDVIRQSEDCKGVLGNNFLSAYTVCINRSQKTIYLREND